MFRKSSMEDFVKFCLSLLPHITKRNFRLPKQWYPLPGLFSLNQKRGCKMGGLTQIHLDLDGQHLYVLVRGVGFSRNIGYILVVGLRTYTYHEVRETGMNHLPLIPLSLQTSYCALLLHVYASRQLYSGTCHRGTILGHTSRRKIISTEKLSNSSDSFFCNLDLGIVIRADMVETVCH